MPHQVTEEPAYEATLVHCEILRRKIDRLNEALQEAMTQLYVSADREFRDGNVSMDDLAELYQRAKGLGAGFSGGWSERMSITPAAMRQYMRTMPPRTRGESSLYWSGPFPFEPGTHRPVKGVAVVYVLYDEANEPIYLGSTGQFSNRMQRHRHAGRRFVWWLAYPCGTREAAYLLEGGLLAARKPVQNVRSGR